LLDRPAAASTSDTVLAAKATELYREARGTGDGRRYFEAQLVLDLILVDHPHSMTALRIKKNRLAGVNVEEVRTQARRWSQVHPGAAEQMRAAFDRSESPPGQSPGSRAPAPTPSPPAPVQQFTQTQVPPQVLPPAEPTDRPRKFTRSDLVQTLKDTTVLILVMNTVEGRLRVVGSGSGFFINQEHILTNAHVVRNAQQLVIASEVLGVGTGTVLAVGQTSQGLGVDAAIIEAAGLRPKSFLTFAHGLLEGDNVAVGGYPGVIRQTDRKLTRLIHFIDERVVPGREDVPSPRFSFGAVEAIFTNPRGNEDIQHGLETTGGNSGSPIVNSCGQVVGLHYSGLSLERDNSKFNYAHSYREVEKFLRSNRIPFSRAEFRCDQG